MKKLRAWPYLSPGMTGFAIFIVIPLLFSIVISFYDWKLFGTPEFIGLDNYKRLVDGRDPAFWTIMRNTAVFAIGYTTFNLILSTLMAMWIDKLGSWKGTFRVLFFIPVVTPMVANALVWRLMLDDAGIVNTMLSGIGLPTPSWLGDPTWAMISLVAMSLWQGIGYNIIVLGAGLNNINPSVLEAARIDGANVIQRFFNVILPLLSPSLFFAMVMTIIGSFKVFAQPFMLTRGGPGDSTKTIVVHLYQNGFSYDRLGYASSLAWVLFVVVMLITALQFAGQKKWVFYDN